jgi:NADPH:quinone reductase-like Zn-dependent oxidoreductase
MKAIVARDFAPIEKLVYADWPEPKASGDMVVIEAEAIGVNYPDGLLVQGLYQLKPPTPFVPGMEVAGRVAAVGEKVKSVKVGDRVAAISSLGSYAEKVAAPEHAVMKLPDGMDAADACALLCGYSTSHYALKQATGGKGVDVAYDPVGGDAFDALSRSVAWGGRLLVIGFASGRIPQLPVNLTLVKGYSVVGVFWGDFTRREPEAFQANMRELVGWYMGGKVKPLIEGSYRLADAASVLQRIHSRCTVGKLILKP